VLGSNELLSKRIRVDNSMRKHRSSDLARNFKDEPNLKGRKVIKTETASNSKEKETIFSFQGVVKEEEELSNHLELASDELVLGAGISLTAREEVLSYRVRRRKTS